MPANFDFASANPNSDWFDICQWKGQFGGSPPRSMGIDVDESSNSGSFNILHDGVPYYQLGGIKPGVWTHFAIGMLLGMTSDSAWTTIYRDGVLVKDPNHGTLNMHYTANMDVRSSYASPTATQTTAAVGATAAQVGTNNITITGTKTTGFSVGQVIGDAGGLIPSGTTITAIVGQVLTLSNAVTFPSTINSSGVVVPTATFVYTPTTQYIYQTGAQSGTNLITANLTTGFTISDLIRSTDTSLTGGMVPASTYIVTKPTTAGVMQMSNPCTLPTTPQQLLGYQADPIYFKIGIYRSVGWSSNGSQVVTSAPVVSTASGDVF